MFDFRALTRPIVQAPMAGGPACPTLAAAVSGAGGLGFLAAGYLSASRLAADIASTRALTDAPFGVNLFVPQPSVATSESLATYRGDLAGEAARYGVEPGRTRPDDDDWAPKLAVLERLRPSVASFTFGLPTRADVDHLHEAGVTVVATVTSAAEAVQALGIGADALCVQGPDAGGHRGTFDPAARPSVRPLEELLAEIVDLTPVPILAAGGLATSEAVRRVLSLGAVAAQIGTAFLRSPDAGTRAIHRAAVAAAEFPDTAVTCAFSGRYARGLVNRFMRDHDATAPLGYPEVNQLTAPLRAAAAAAGDPHGVSLWAGTGHALAEELPAADIVRMLAP